STVCRQHGVDPVWWTPIHLRRRCHQRRRVTDLMRRRSDRRFPAIATFLPVVLPRPVDSAQYTSLAFGGRCREAGVRPSMGSVGDAYDNAMCESFFATLECELLAR